MRRASLFYSCPGRLRVTGLRFSSVAYARLLSDLLAFGLIALPVVLRAEEVQTVIVTSQPESGPEGIAPTTFATVIETDEHAAEIETVTEALAESVGIQVRRYGGLGAFSTVSIRGSASNQVQIYLDGIPLSRAQNETVNLADLPIDILDHIEVYRGAVPVTFGIAGPGGVVNLVTKTPSIEPSLELSTAYGSFDTRKAVASYSQQIHGIGVLAHVSYLGSEGDFSFEEDATPAQPGGNDSLTRKNNDFDSVNGIVKASYEFASGTEIDVSSEAFYKDQGVPGPTGPFSFPGPAVPPQRFHTSFEELRSLNFLRVRQSGFLSKRVDISGTVFGVYEVQRLADKQGELGRGNQDRDDSTVNAGGNATATYALSAAHALIGFTELSHETFSPRNEVQPNPDGPDQTRLRYALGFQDNAWIAPDFVLLTPSIRYEHLDDDVTGFLPAGMPQGSESVSRDLWSGNIGLQVLPVEWLNLKANLGRYQRAPNFAELFGFGVGVIGNPRLEPETAINRDIGFVTTAPDLPWSAEGRLEYAYFNNDIDDIITLVQTGPATARAMNIGAARIRGHEVVFNVDLLEHLSIDLNYTHQDAEDRGDDINVNGKPLPFRPADELYTRLELYDALGKLYYEFNFIGSNCLKRACLSRDRVGERNVHTAGVAFNATEWLTLRFEGRNLSDNQIRDVADYPLPGRSFFGSVSAQF